VQLRYGINPHQTAHAEPIVPGRAPVRVVHGSPSYLNLLDALNGWQLVRLASRTLGRPAAASFKHVSPAGAAIGGTVANAYRRARDADPKSSYGDFAAVSHPVDAELADNLQRVVSDGIVAPGYEEGTVAQLSKKKRGTFLILEADPDFVAPTEEVRDVYGLRLTQHRDDDPPSLQNHEPLPENAHGDLQLGMIVLRYTQSNAVCYVRDGQTLGIGAGQQSRIDCTALAGAKVETWWARRHPDCRPTDLAYVSDGALPFRDNVDEAARHGVRYLAEPGGSIRSPEVERACDEHGITYVRTSRRLFHH
jgi:phosphoribosylaminoimidazolecarboxamide formyltransferase / IMP cyclohydrolase